MATQIHQTQVHTRRFLTAFSPFLQQTEIAKRLNAILAQIMPFLSQEVSVEIFNQWDLHEHHFLNMLIMQMY